MAKDTKSGLARGLTNYGDAGFSLYLRRSFAKSMGYSGEMLARPAIGIADSRSGYNNCHRHFPELIEAVKRGVMAEPPNAEPKIEPIAAALRALDDGYTREGAAGGWTGHYQGGPIGYAQREFEIAPCQDDSRWYHTRIEAGHAVAWNPSLPGGAKAEDTYLVQEDGMERVTSGPGWPVEDGDDLVPPRPAVLELGR